MELVDHFFWGGLPSKLPSTARATIGTSPSTSATGAKSTAVRLDPVRRRSRPLSIKGIALQPDMYSRSCRTERTAGLELLKRGFRLPQSKDECAAASQAPKNLHRLAVQRGVRKVRVPLWRWAGRVSMVGIGAIMGAVLLQLRLNGRPGRAGVEGQVPARLLHLPPCGFLHSELLASRILL